MYRQLEVAKELLGEHLMANRQTVRTLLIYCMFGINLDALLAQLRRVRLQCYAGTLYTKLRR